MSRSISQARDPQRFAKPARRLAVLGVVLALAVPTGAAAAFTRERAPLVLPPVGKLYDALSVAWWQYALAQPATSNPLSDPTGAGCRVGQSGLVFFLVGTFDGSAATRDQCTVPAGRALFFPLINAIDFHVPGLDTQDTPKKIWDDFLTFGFRADALQASVDGAPVGNLDPATTPYRGCAAPVAGCVRAFSVTLPAGNVFGALIGAGTYGPAVADGFYLLLAPLRPGAHTITFGGTGFFGGPTAQNVTYHLRVLPLSDRDS
jgi:hypothetical protein